VAASADDVRGGRSPRSGFAEAADQAVNLPAIGVVLVAGAVTLLVGQRWWDPVADARVTVPVFSLLAVVGAGLCGFLLDVRARLLDDVRVRWVAAGFAVAAVVGAVQGIALLDLRHAPVAVTETGITLLLLLWHAALPTFVLLGHRGGPLGRHRWMVAAAWAVLVAAALVLPAGAVGLVDDAGAFTSRYGAALLALAALTVLALVVWFRPAGREVTRPQVWVAVCLVLALLDLLLSSRAEQPFEAIWWSSAALRSLQFAVPAVGLLADSARLSTLLHRHERGLAAKLEEELLLAAEATEAAEPGVGATGQGDLTAAADPAWTRVHTVLVHGRFHPVFQPIYSLADGRLLTVEALTRFTAEPVRPPDVWFAEAHAVGLGIELELATLRAALREGGALPAGVELAVNLSPGVLVDPRVHAELTDREGGQPLLVEVTEHAAVDDYPRLTAVLDQLRAAGIRVAVDDAGAGFASLRHVVRLAPDVLKLDRTLTRDVHVDPVQRSLATCLAAFARQTGTQLVAEGVEHPDELAIWQELGADAAQGYLLGRPGPLPAAEVTDVLAGRARRRRQHRRREGASSVR
jgi:EAL domain-containing protein (putative c-di-GMP-specific phosphodiesterase class I)